MENLRKQNLVWVLPLSVKVYSSQTRPVIPANDPIDVYHRNYLKHKMLAQQVRIRGVIFSQEIDNSLHNKRAIALTGMNAS